MSPTLEALPPPSMQDDAVLVISELRPEKIRTHQYESNASIATGQRERGGEVVVPGKQIVQWEAVRAKPVDAVETNLYQIFQRVTQVVGRSWEQDYSLDGKKSREIVTAFGENDGSAPVSLPFRDAVHVLAANEMKMKTEPKVTEILCDDGSHYSLYGPVAVSAPQLPVTSGASKPFRLLASTSGTTL